MEDEEEYEEQGASGSSSTLEEAAASEAASIDRWAMVQSYLCKAFSCRILKKIP